MSDDPAIFGRYRTGSVPFADLMDALASEDGDEGEGATAGTGSAGSTPEVPTAGTYGPGSQRSAGDGQGAAADGQQGGQEPGPAGGDAGAGAAGAAAASGVADTGFDVSTVLPKIAGLTTAFEENTITALRQEVFDKMRADEGYAKYFDALSQHPYMLAGQTVPAIGRDGTQVLRDAAEAEQWQGALRQTIGQQIERDAGIRQEEMRPFIDLVHRSIGVFSDNPDLIPGAKGFDKELADRFVALAAPYAVKSEDGALQGWSIDVQPLIKNLRADVQAARTARAGTSASKGSAPAASRGAPATPSNGRSDSPQAGIQSKSGSGGEPPEDFDTLFRTLGNRGLVTKI